MVFFVVDKVSLTCSYGTCSSKLKVSPLEIPIEAVSTGVGAVGGGVVLGASLTVPDGLVKKFDASGKVVAQANFKAGVAMGESATFDAKGQATQRLMFVGGKLHGPATIYDNGVATAQMHFNKGVMAGESKFYDAQGRLAVQTNFAAGKEHGMRVTYNVETGAVLSKEEFVNGVMKGAAQQSQAIKSGIGAQAQGGAGVGIGLTASIKVPTVSGGIDMNLDSIATVDGNAVGSVMDHLPNINIRPFCYCTSRANPAVAEATKKANGQLRPQPCTPKTTTPWLPGSHDATMLDKPTLTHTSKLICVYAGVIEIEDPGQNKATVP